MIRFILIIITIALTSCGHGKLGKYESIVQDADRFEIFYNAANKAVAVPSEQTSNFKIILTRNINPEGQRKFINDVRIDIYKGNQRTGFLTITNGSNNPFVNFNSDGLNFGFRLTYEIGQWIDNS